MKLFNQQCQMMQIDIRWFVEIQKIWAERMSSLTVGLSKKSLIIMLIGFIILTGGLSFFLIYRGITSRVYDTITIDPISRPSEVYDSTDGNTIPTLKEVLEEKSVKR